MNFLGFKHIACEKYRENICKLRASEENKTLISKFKKARIGDKG